MGILKRQNEEAIRKYQQSKVPVPHPTASKSDIARKRDAVHQMAIHNSPFELRRKHPSAPLHIEPNPGSKFERDSGGPGVVWHFWGWELLIAVIETIHQHYQEEDGSDGN